MIQNNRKALFDRIFLTFWRKIFFFKYLSLFNVLIKKSCLNKSKFSSEFALYKHGKKNNFLSISVLVSEIVILCLKRKVFYEFPQQKGIV